MSEFKTCDQWVEHLDENTKTLIDGNTYELVKSTWEVATSAIKPETVTEIERLQSRVSELESALKRQGNAAKMGMDAAKKDAIWREENAKRLLSESNPAAIESERAANAELTEEIGHLEDSLIKQGQMLREIVNITKGPPEENSWHSTHDAVESVERLQARVADLEQAASVSEWIKCTEQLPTEDAGTDLDMSVTIGTFQR